MKLERKLKKVLFLAPKVYAHIDLDDKTTIKVKGLNKKSLKKVTFSDLESLLNKNIELKFDQDKWFRSITEGRISIKDQFYTLHVTDNKRKLIYNNGLLVGSKPYIINDR